MASAINHSDRGIQYASKEFRKIVKSCPLITHSMSRRANCWDNNAAAKFFFKRLKTELIYGNTLESIEEAKLLVMH